MHIYIYIYIYTRTYISPPRAPDSARSSSLMVCLINVNLFNDEVLEKSNNEECIKQIADIKDEEGLKNARSSSLMVVRVVEGCSGRGVQWIGVVLFRCISLVVVLFWDGGSVM